MAIWSARFKLLLAVAFLFALQTKALASGQVVIETRPKGAEVLLDGRPAGLTPWIRDGIPAGRHLVTLRASGYEATRFPITVIDDLTVRHHLLLRPLSSHQAGEASLVSQPTGCTVYLDGRRVGTTPVRLEHLQVGTHRLRFEHRGYHSLCRILSVVADLTSERHATLAPLPPFRPPQRTASHRTSHAPDTRIGSYSPSLRASELAHALRKKRRVVEHPVPGVFSLKPPRVTSAPQGRRSAMPVPATSRPASAALSALDSARAFERRAPDRSIPYGAFCGMMLGFMLAVGMACWRFRSRSAELEWQPDLPPVSFRALSPANGRISLRAAQAELTGMREFFNGRTAAGEAAMREAYALAPCPETLFNLALAWQLSGSPFAEVAYRSLLQLDPAYRDARFNLAVLLSQSECPTAAILVYRELLKDLPSDGAAWFNLGNLYVRLGSLSDGLRALKQAKRSLKSDPALRINLQLCKRRIRERRSALRRTFRPGFLMGGAALR